MQKKNGQIMNFFQKAITGTLSPKFCIFGRKLTQQKSFQTGYNLVFWGREMGQLLPPLTQHH